MENKTMMTDFYELTMAQTYFDKGEQNKKVYFDIFFRSNPFNGGYAIMGGLDNIVDYINNMDVYVRDKQGNILKHHAHIGAFNMYDCQKIIIDVNKNE